MRGTAFSKPFLKPSTYAIGSINSPMQCMMKEIGAQCLQRHVDPKTGQETFIFSCFNQDQPLDHVDFIHLNSAPAALNSVLEKLSDLWLERLLKETDRVPRESEEQTGRPAPAHRAAGVRRLCPARRASSRAAAATTSRSRWLYHPVCEGARPARRAYQALGYPQPPAGSDRDDVRAAHAVGPAARPVRAAVQAARAGRRGAGGPGSCSGTEEPGVSRRSRWSPLSILLSSFHGNTDPLYAALLLAAALALDAERPFTAGALLALSLQVKLIRAARGARLAVLGARRAGAPRGSWRGLSLAVLPFLPLVLWEPRIFLEHVLGYSAGIDLWGHQRPAGAGAGTPPAGAAVHWRSASG